MMKWKIGFIKLNISTRNNLLSNKIINFVSFLAIRIAKKTQGLPLEANLSRLCLGVEMKQREPNDLR